MTAPMHIADMDARPNARLPAHFGANRAYGRIALHVEWADGVTRLVRVREEGSLRVRFPAHTGHAEAVILNTAGGVAGGDRFATEVSVGANAELAVTTTSAEKVYRSPGPAAKSDIRLIVADGAALAWLPQETILFDRARFDRTISIDLDASARLVFAEAMVFGRSAMGETVTTALLADRWRVRRDGRLIYADGVRLDGDVAATLSKLASAGGAVAVATVLMVPGDDALVAAIHAREAELRGEVGVSAWNGMAAVRLLAADGAALRHDLACVLGAAQCPLPRLWLN